MSDMTAEVSISTTSDNIVGRVLLRLSQFMAIVGGIVFLLLVGVSVVSIIGRKLFAAPVPGDMELMQMAAAAAGACFFAYCHISYNDLKVELVTIKLPFRVNAFLDGVASLAMATFAFLLTWRTYVAAQGTLETGESSAILAWPVAYFQFGMVPGFFLFMLVALYTAYRHFGDAFTSPKLAS